MDGVSDAPQTTASPDVPRPRPQQEPAPAPRRPAAGRRSLTLALLLGAVGAAAVLLAAGKTWATGSAPLTGGGLVPVRVTGKTVSGLPDALALVGLAALLAVFSVRRTGRLVVSALLTLCGAGVIWTAAATSSGTAALNSAAARASGLTDTTVRHVAHTGWPWAAALGGALLLAAGVTALLRSHTWPAMSARYERDAAPGRPAARTPRTAPDPDHPGELWKALDRGEDPTARDD